MSAKTSAAEHVAATKATSSDSGATPASGRTADITTGTARFGMPHALVIIACIITAATLARLGMSVQDVLLLLAGAGSIGAAIVVLAVTGGRRDGGRVGRFLCAYLSSGN
ncbi:hypothetical protein [Streptomyces netropsis]|uniref:Uncharacterized protein n=1 Tax=Streptomyces netropsis TaxID=55404 RepID=A0A7W7LIL4_STRNE|nr:hypothetical protein [Streptomyces netropsis]MBB4890895.1 hypothetical protein [Streptomyces netropsis]